jgi:2-methylcitrate dehydratase PrpD
VLGDAGLDAFTEERVRDERLRGLAAKVRYVVDPANPYPADYTGHARAVLKDGQVVEERQPHLRGGAHEPLARRELEDKFRRNCAHGGWPAERAEAFLARAGRFFDAPVDLEFCRG